MECNGSKQSVVQCNDSKQAVVQCNDSTQWCSAMIAGSQWRNAMIAGSQRWKFTVECNGKCNGRGSSRSRYELGNKCVIMIHFCCEIIYCSCLIDSGQLQLNH